MRAQHLLMHTFQRDAVARNQTKNEKRTKKKQTQRIADNNKFLLIILYSMTVLIESCPSLCLLYK